MRRLKRKVTFYMVEYKGKYVFNEVDFTTKIKMVDYNGIDIVNYGNKDKDFFLGNLRVADALGVRGSSRTIKDLVDRIDKAIEEKNWNYDIIRNFQGNPGMVKGLIEYCPLSKVKIGIV